MDAERYLSTSHAASLIYPKQTFSQLSVISIRAKDHFAETWCKIRAMFRSFSLTVALLIPAIAFHCSAQVLSSSERQELVTRLKDSSADWQQRLNSLDIDKLNVSFSVGKLIDGHKEVALRELSLMRGVLDRLLLQDNLVAEISVEDSLQNLMSSIITISDLSPPNAEATRWRENAPSIKEIGSFSLPLARHILAYPA